VDAKRDQTKGENRADAAEEARAAVHTFFYDKNKEGQNKGGKAQENQVFVCHRRIKSINQRRYDALNAA
jgi:hypothetical protein